MNTNLCKIEYLTEIPWNFPLAFHIFLEKLNRLYSDFAIAQDSEQF